MLLLRLVFFFFFTTPHQSCFLQATPGHYCPPSTIYRFPNPSRFRNFLLSFCLRSAQAKTLDASSGINLQKLISKFPKSPAAACCCPSPSSFSKNPFPLHQTSPGNSCKSEQDTHTHLTSKRLPRQPEHRNLSPNCGRSGNFSPQKKRLKNHTEFFAQILQLSNRQELGKTEAKHASERN